MGRWFRPCSFEGCGRGVYALGLCTKHYDRHRRKGSAYAHSIKDVNDVYANPDGETHTVVLKSRSGEEVAFAVVDSDSLGQVLGYKWRYDAIRGDAVTGLNPVRSMQQHLLGFSERVAACNKDGDRLNNRRDNLEMWSKYRRAEANGWVLKRRTVMRHSNEANKGGLYRQVIKEYKGDLWEQLKQGRPWYFSEDTGLYHGYVLVEGAVVSVGASSSMAGCNALRNRYLGRLQKKRAAAVRGRRLEFERRRSSLESRQLKLPTILERLKSEAAAAGVPFVMPEPVTAPVSSCPAS